jgi:TatD DNase family protein
LESKKRPIAEQRYPTIKAISGSENMYRLVDTHAHLDEIENLDQAIGEARSAGVIAIVAVGANYESNNKALEIAQGYRGFVYPALGLHPWNLKPAEIEHNLEFIEMHIDEAIAIGEIGLDYHKRVRAVAEKDTQKSVLRQLLALARRYDKLVSIHSRYAWRDALDLVQEARIEKAVFHWFTGPSSVLRDIIEQGYFISATPAVEYHEEHRRAIKEIPLERLLLETDSPVVYGRGREFEFEARPAAVLKSLKGAANLRSVSENQIAEITTENAVKLFQLDK